MSNNKIIPFGKYKGQEIEQVIARDPQYVQWIMQQAWFQEKFQPIYQVVINQFAPPSEDTPAHNALQVRFLEHDFREAFWLAVDLVKESDHNWLQQQFRHNMHAVRGAPRPCSRYRAWVRDNPDKKDSWIYRAWVEHRTNVRKQWDAWRKLRSMPPIEVEIGTAKFEDVTDVVFNVSLGIELEGYSELAAYCCYRLGIEIKPSMGDDYPAVLRQIKRQRSMPADNRPSHWFLLVDEFGSSVVTLDQVRRIFAQDGIKLVLMAELRAMFE